MPKRRNPCETFSEIRLRNWNGDIVRDQRNIAARKGVTQNYMLKKHLQEIVEAFPQELRDKKIPCAPPKEFRIQLSSVRLKQQIENIAHNIGVEPNTLLQVKLAEKVVSYPPHMKQPLML